MPSQDNDHSGIIYLVASSKQMLKKSTPILLQPKKLTVVGRHGLVDNPSVYGTKGPEFKTQWRQELIYIDRVPYFHQ